MRPVCGPTGLQLQDFSTAGAHNNTFTLEKAAKREYIDNVNKKRYTEYNRTRGVIIMANTNINIRMDTDLKKQFEAFCADMGMTMTTAFNIFARKAVREYRIPFEISGDVPNAETVEAIQEVKRMKANPSLGKTYSDVDQMIEELLADV